jgi:hypothetical protein
VKSLKSISDRTALWLAWSAFAIAVGLFAADMVMGVLTLSLHESGSWASSNLVFGAAFVLTLLTFPTVGVVLATKRPRNAIGWLLLAIGVAWGIADLTTYSDYGLRLHPGSLPLATYVAPVASSFWLPPIALMGTFLILLFPDGHLLTPRWRWVARLSAFVIVFGPLALVTSPGKLADAGYPHTVNPLGISALDGVSGYLQISISLVPIAMLLSAICLVLRYRRSHGIERLQVKWLAAAAMVIAVTYAFVETLSLLVNFNGPTPTWLSALQDVALCSFGLIPIAIGFGVLRYRLYEIDVIIRRTIVYAALTATLAALYLGGIALLGAASRSLTGQSSAVAVTISTLIVAVAFQPVRTRIQGAVERRFYRGTYDVEVAVRNFSGRLREQIELEALSQDLLATVHNTVQPRSATLWLRSVTISERSPGTTEA